MMTKRIFSLALIVAMLASMFTGLNIVSAQEDTTPAEDLEFNKFKDIGVFYDLSADTTHTGKGTGMYIEVSGNPHIYNVGTEEGLAEFKADPLYASLGTQVETAVSNKKASYASYTDKDQAYSFTEYAGKPALYGINNVATQHVGNWKECLSAPNLYWMTTSDYFSPEDSHATFVVQYYDNTGSFTFKYALQGGTNTGFTITKGGTNQWVTKAFQVSNARLNKNLTNTAFMHGSHTGRFEFNSETYISKFAILKTSDYEKIKAGVALDFENDTMCQFMRNSDLVKLETMNYPDAAAAGTQLSTKTIPGFSTDLSGNSKELASTVIGIDPTDANNYVLSDYHPAYKKENNVENPNVTNHVYYNLDANCDSDYILLSHRFYYPNQYMRFYPSLEFKQYKDGAKNPAGSITNKAAWSGIIKHSEISDEKTGAKKTFSSGKYANKWTEWDYVIDTVNLTADLYVDHEYVLTYDIAAYTGLSKSSYYISGIDKLGFRFDRTAGAGTAYWDDIQVRKINASQVSAIDDYMTSIPGEVNNGTVLPATTAFTKQAATWSVVTEGTGVEIAGNTVSVPAEFYGNVEYKATLANGTEKTYSILTCGFRANVVKDTYDNYPYYVGENIYNNQIPNYKIIYTNDALAENLIHKVTTIEQDPDGAAGDLVIKRTQTHASRGTSNTQRTVNTGDLNSDYILWSVKYKIPAQYFRINLYFHYKDANGNISTSTNAGMNFIINGGEISNEFGVNNTNNKLGGRIEKASFTAGKYANKWVEFKVVIDTKNNNGRVYIDDDYLYTHTIIRNRTAVVADGVNVCGIRMAEFQPDWGAGVLTAPAYFDDMAVSKMSTEDTVIADLKMLDLPENIVKGNTLPVTTAIAGKTITWTTDNDAVTVDANGVVAVAGGFKGDVTYTATVNDGTINRSHTYVVPTSLGNKYAEYIFGFDQDKAYGMDSYNVAYANGDNGNYYTQKINGYRVRNTIIDFGKEKTFYYVVKDPAATSNTADSREVTYEEYQAFTGLKQTYTARFFNTSAQTGDSAHNRYEAIGPEGDKRAAVMGVNHMRYDGRLSRKSTNSMIHFNASSTFGASDNALVVEADVYDVGTHNLCLQYRTTAGKTVDANVKLTNTGVWKTFKFELTDADFSKESGTGLGDSLQDFRFQISTPTYISAVRVYTQEKEQVAESDYTKKTLRDYDVYITKDGTISAKEYITAAQAQDAKLYIAIYDKQGDLVSVATSDNVTNGTAATITTGTTASKLDPMEHSIKTFLWDSDLKPYR